MPTSSSASPRTWLAPALLLVLTASTAATAVGTAIGTTHTDRPTTTHTSDTQKTPHKGMQFVNYKTVTIEVPRSWVARSDCAAGHLHPVVLSPGGIQGGCGLTFQAGISEVVFDPMNLSRAAVESVSTAIVRVNGHYAEQIKAAVPLTQQNYLALAIADAGVTIAVLTPDFSLAERILSSVTVNNPR